MDSRNENKSLKDIQAKIEYLRYQRDNHVGNYRLYLANLYNYYRKKADDNNADWCYSDNSDIEKLHKLIIVGASRPDVSFTAVKGYQKELFDYGYFKWKKVDDKWQLHIVKPLDF